MMRRACLVLLLASLSAPVAIAQSTDAFAGVPDITYAYYDVAGITASDLRLAIDEVRPTDPHDGKKVDALSNWGMTWSQKGDGKGGCDLASITLSFSATVVMPRLTAPASLSPELRARWQIYIAALEKHEAGHLRYAYDHHDEVLTAIRGATCATIDAAATAAIEKIDQYNIEYDRQTRHGETQGAVFP
ncbi:putative secreted Zn-dependent protease [Sphingomonas sp. UYAg733]